MPVIGKIESVWRYPVKSMRGEALSAVFAGFSGVYGDRLFALKSGAAPAGFPYFTGRERHDMLLYQPRFRNPARSAMPPNRAEAEEIAPGLNPVGADPADLALDVQTPTGEVLAIDDPALLRKLTEGTGNGPVLTLLRSERAMTDCRPISLSWGRRWLPSSISAGFGPMCISISEKRPAFGKTSCSAASCVWEPGPSSR
jgi:hypothetical protein